MNPIIYIVAATVVSILLWLAIRYNSKRTPQPARTVEEQPGSRQPDRIRRRNVLTRVQQRAAEAQNLDQDSDEDSYKDPKVGTKKMKKLQEKEERKRIREIELREREERKKEQAERDEIRKLEDERQLKEEARKAEEEKLKQEEKEKREHEEYLKLKAMFSVEEEGQQEISCEEGGENMLLQFVEFIKSRKVVLLEDLASHFGLRAQDAIDRVQTMLNDEILSGVIDDRGKFIYISNDELHAVAKFVYQRGRVSISDLAQASNSLVTLTSESPMAIS